MVFLELAKNQSLRSADSAGAPADALRTRLKGQDAQDARARKMAAPLLYRQQESG